MQKLSAFFLCLVLMSVPAAADEAAEVEIKSVIESCYVNGAFNDLDADAMREGFHEDFAIFGVDGEKLSKYPIATWASGVEKRKADPEFDPAQNVWEHEFAMLDVTDGSAMAKVELSHEGKHVYTDYLLLLKFDSGWRIVAKVYTKH
jgi:hypothetical protein